MLFCNHGQVSTQSEWFLNHRKTNTYNNRKHTCMAWTYMHSNGKFSGQFDPSVTVDMVIVTCLKPELAILIKTNRNNPSQKSVVLESAVRQPRLGLVKHSRTTDSESNVAWIGREAINTSFIKPLIFRESYYLSDLSPLVFCHMWVMAYHTIIIIYDYISKWTQPSRIM